MIAHALRTTVYVVTTFAVQGVSHFIVSAEHYAVVNHMRAEPIFPLGILAMLCQGGVLSYLYSRSEWAQRSILHSVAFGWHAGAFLVSYLAFAEAAKYTVPDAMSWMATEVTSGFIQFTLYGAALGMLGMLYAPQPQAGDTEAL
jgi:hypothetical protein